MEEKMAEIRRIIDDWYSFKLKMTVADIMPYVVFLSEEYEQAVKQLKQYHR